MEEIRIDSFKGIAPRYGKNLPVGFAETAQNCMLYHGRLAPLAKNTLVQADVNHYNSMAYHCETWYRQNNAFYCPWKIGVLDLLLYKDTSNYLKKKVSWIITKTDISFDAASKEIRSANGDFNVDSLIEGTTFVVSGSDSNDGTFTVSSTATTSTVITVDEAVMDEAAGASIAIKVCEEDYLGQTRQDAITDIVLEGLAESEVGEWSLMANQFGGETRVVRLIEYNGKIYTGSEPNAKLLEWNDSDAWIERADRTGIDEGIHSLCEYYSKLYGGAYNGPGLLEWNDVNAWVKRAGQAATETCTHSIAVYGGDLYANGSTDGTLLKWNDVDDWDIVAPQLGAEITIHCLKVFDGGLYGGTEPSGKLYKWNDVNAWIEVAPQLGTETIIFKMVELDGELYAGTGPNGKLYKWNGVNAWEEVADQFDSETHITSLVVHDGKIFGGSKPNGYLLEWNGTDAWIKRADTYESETQIDSLLSSGGYIYAGTGTSGLLLKWVPSTTIYERQYFWTLMRNIGGHIDESGPSAVSDTVTVAEGQIVTVTIPAWTGLGADTYITHWNLYRLSNATGAWQLVDTIAWGTDEYVDDVSDVDLGATCPSYYTSEQGNEIIWDKPPKNLDGITTEPLYGIIFGWKGSTLYWNDPGYPDAWVDFYNMNFPAEIKNCIPREPALAVLTAIGPFRVDGNNPETLQQSGVCGPNQATSILGCCKSELDEGGILYLSDSGVAFFNMSSSRIITDDGFGEKWFKANVSPTGAVMIEVDNIAYLFHSGGGLMVDFRSETPIATTLSEIIYGAYRKKDDDELYVMDGAGIQKFGAAAGTKAMTWKSGELLGDHPEEKTFVETELLSNSEVSVVVTNYVDGTSSFTATLAMDTVRDKRLGFLDTKAVGRATQIQIYKAEHDTLTPPELEITEAIVRYTR